MQPISVQQKLKVPVTILIVVLMQLSNSLFPVALLAANNTPPNLSPCQTTTVEAAPPPPYVPKHTPNPSCTPAPIAVVVLLDTSISMSRTVHVFPSLTIIPNQRMVKSKQVIKSFVSNLKSSDIFALVQFSGTPFDVHYADFSKIPNASIVISPKSVQYVTPTIDNQLNSITTYGSTHTRDGFLLAQSVLKTIKVENPDHKRYLIVLTDGVPKQSAQPADQPLTPDEAQNPLRSPNLAKQIKLDGTKIITIGLELDQLSQLNGAAVENDPIVLYAKNQIRDMASSLEDSYEDIVTGNLNPVYDDIATSICRNRN